MLQPAKPAVSATEAKSGGISAGGAVTSQPLNAKVAQSMASKLSDAELAAIIAMTDKLSKLEKEVHLLRNEKEVIAAKLEGTEAVKQFLIGKVRDVEIKLSRSKEDEVKVTQQIASDQEVIAFLDSRVQELEQQTEYLTKEKTATQAELDSLKVSTSKKITMLSDMLKYEREKIREDEGEWKATKKVLVKEVKSCRAQILALQAERDGLKEHNDMLRRAIVQTGGSGGGCKNNASGSSRSPGRRKNT
jgi:chromosome segregation ATPase